MIKQVLSVDFTTRKRSVAWNPLYKRRWRLNFYLVVQMHRNFVIFELAYRRQQFALNSTTKKARLAYVIGI